MNRIVNAVFLEGSTTNQLLAAFLHLPGINRIAGNPHLRAGEYSAFQAALRIKQILRGELFKHLLEIGPAVLVDAEDEDGRTGELVNTAMQSEALEAYYSQYLPQLALAALIPLSILVFLTPLDPLTAIILLLTAPLLPLFMFLIGNAAQTQTRSQWLGLSRMSAYFLDVFQGLTTLKLLGRSREQATTIDQVPRKPSSGSIRVLRVTFLSALALEMIATLSTAVVAVEIGLRLLNGRLVFEQAFFILLLTPEFYLPLRMLGLRFHAGISGVEAAKRIFEILDIPSQSKSIPPSMPGAPSALNQQTPPSN